MQAASLNYRDTLMARRGYGRRSGNLPLVFDRAQVERTLEASKTWRRVGYVCIRYAKQASDVPELATFRRKIRFSESGRAEIDTRRSRQD